MVAWKVYVSFLEMWTLFTFDLWKKESEGVVKRISYLFVCKIIIITELFWVKDSGMNWEIEKSKNYERKGSRSGLAPG